MTSRIKRVISIISLTAVVIITVAVSILGSNTNTGTQNKETINIPKEKSDLTNKIRETRKLSNTEVSVSKDTVREKEPKVTPADWHELQQWKRAIGYPLPGEDKIYSEYSIEMLAHMAANGDIIAIQELGTRAYNLELSSNVQTSLDFALGAYEDAAVRGSTYALTLIGDHKLSGVGLEENNQKRTEMIVDGLAWYKVASIRGDISVKYRHFDPFVSINNISLSSKMEKNINLKAEEIFKRLQSQRLDLGLDEYDNSTDEIMQLLYQ